MRTLLIPRKIRGATDTPTDQLVEVLEERPALFRATKGVYMKSNIRNYLRWATFLICLGYSSLAPCTTKPVNDASIKIYVEPENISLCGKEIYVCIQQNWLRTSALFSDAAGVYVNGWTCPRCSANNTGTWSCESCGYRRYNEKTDGS